MDTQLYKTKNTMKKCFLSFFIIFLAVFAQSQTVSINDYNQDPGTSLVVSVNLDNINNVGALTLFIGYDSLVLEFDTILNVSGQFPGLLSNNMQNLQKVGLAWSAASSGVSVSSGTLCDIRFNYIGNSCDLLFTSGCELADFNADVISTTFDNGSISESFIVEITGINLSYCISEPTFTLTGSPTGGIFKINNIPSSVFFPFLLGPGTHIVSYSYLNNYGFGDTISVNVDVFDDPTINIQSTGVICFGQPAGEATANILTGQTPFTYNWSDGQSNQTATSLVAGSYSVTVTDNNGCLVTDNTTILSSNEIVYDLAVTHLSGFGNADGSIDLSIISGNAPFLTNWSNSSTTEDISSLTYGVYYVTLTDNLGCTITDSSEVKINSSQQLNIPQQWSIISFNIDLFESLVDSAFSDIATNLILAKDEDGAVYWVFFQLNNIGNIEIGEGYQVKMSNPDTLISDGFYIFPEENSINLQAGWSMFGYLRTSPGLIVPILAPIISNVLLVKNGAGNVYWPIFGLDLIIDMYPGEGFQIKMLAPDQLVYPPN